MSNEARDSIEEQRRQFHSSLINWERRYNGLQATEPKPTFNLKRIGLVGAAAIALAGISLYSYSTPNIQENRSEQSYVDVNTPKTVETPQDSTIHIKPGDTLWDISKDRLEELYEVGLNRPKTLKESIEQTNHLIRYLSEQNGIEDPDRIFAGEQLTYNEEEALHRLQPVTPGQSDSIGITDPHSFTAESQDRDRGGLEQTIQDVDTVDSSTQTQPDTTLYTDRIVTAYKDSVQADSLNGAAKAGVQNRASRLQEMAEYRQTHSAEETLEWAQERFDVTQDTLRKDQETYVSLQDTVTFEDYLHQNTTLDSISTSTGIPKNRLIEQMAFVYQEMKDHPDSMSEVRMRMMMNPAMYNSKVTETAESLDRVQTLLVREILNYEQ